LLLRIRVKCQRIGAHPPALEETAAALDGKSSQYPGRLMPSATERSILTAPGPVARAASRAARDPEQRWMLTQPREIRRSFAEEVFGREDADLRQEVWMLRQAKAVRESFVANVLLREDPPPLQTIWMLRQPDKVRASFVRDVLLAA
jgi:hypothetical protein